MRPSRIACRQHLRPHPGAFSAVPMVFSARCALVHYRQARCLSSKTIGQLAPRGLRCARCGECRPYRLQHSSLQRRNFSHGEIQTASVENAAPSLAFTAQISFLHDKKSMQSVEFKREIYFALQQFECSGFSKNKPCQPDKAIAAITGSWSLKEHSFTHCVALPAPGLPPQALPVAQGMVLNPPVHEMCRCALH